MSFQRGEKRIKLYVLINYNSFGRYVYACMRMHNIDYLNTPIHFPKYSFLSNDIQPNYLVIPPSVDTLSAKFIFIYIDVCYFL